MARADFSRELLSGWNSPNQVQSHGGVLTGLGHIGGSDGIAVDGGVVEGWQVNQGADVPGCDPAEIHGLLGPRAYRRYERRALEETVQLYPDAVIAMPGGIVSDPATFNLLLAHCFAVWLRASPEEHMQRVIAQADLRPMAGNAEAMDDLKRILDGRAAFYAKADLRIDTSANDEAGTYAELRKQVQKVIAHGG